MDPEFRNEIAASQPDFNCVDVLKIQCVETFQGVDVLAQHHASCFTSVMFTAGTPEAGCGT